MALQDRVQPRHQFGRAAGRAMCAARIDRVVADDERSQLRNRQLAVERFRDRMAAGLHIDKPRRPTRPSKGAKERRLTAKRHLSERKRSRRADFDE